MVQGDVVSPPTTPSWSPFRVCGAGARAPRARSVRTPEGIGDRLRTAAFAELQARHAFDYAAERFVEAPPALRRAWRALALAEDRHLSWLLSRMTGLGVGVDERTVSDALWHYLVGLDDATQFARAMADAEERGRVAGERVAAHLADLDPETAEVFERIAEEEVEHIALAARFFGPPAP